MATKQGNVCLFWGVCQSLRILEHSKICQTFHGPSKPFPFEGMISITDVQKTRPAGFGVGPIVQSSSRSRSPYGPCLASHCSLTVRGITIDRPYFGVGLRLYRINTHTCGAASDVQTQKLFDQLVVRTVMCFWTNIVFYLCFFLCCALSPLTSPCGVHAHWGILSAWRPPCQAA